MRLPTNAEAMATWSAVPQESLAAFDPDGDTTRRVLLNPHIFRLLGDVTGAAMLDAGCGQGYLARMLAGRGARVTGVEPARAPYEYAVARERERRQQIRYLQADLAGAGGLDGQFHAVVANVVFWAIPDWIPALRPGGLLVFSLEHSCFEDGTRSRHEHDCVEVREYLHDYARVGPYGTDFHRPCPTTSTRSSAWAPPLPRSPSPPSRPATRPPPGRPPCTCPASSSSPPATPDSPPTLLTTPGNSPRRHPHMQRRAPRLFRYWAARPPACSAVWTGWRGGPCGGSRRPAYWPHFHRRFPADRACREPPGAPFGKAGLGEHRATADSGCFRGTGAEAQVAAVLRCLAHICRIVGYGSVAVRGRSADW